MRKALDVVHAVLLGVVQGVVEWLPVSSEGVVSLAGRLLFKTPYWEAISTAIWLHTGTMLAAAIYFRRELKAVIASIFSEREDRTLLVFLTISTLATFPTAFLLLSTVTRLELPDGAFTILVGAMLVAVSTARKLVYGRRVTVRNTHASAVVTGLVQGFAVIPGVSRSGVTIAALLYQGYSLKDALTLSYLMSIPVTAGAQLVLPLAGGSIDLSPAGLVGLAASAVAGYATIGLLLRFSEKIDFAKATLALGTLVIAVGFLLLS